MPHATTTQGVLPIDAISAGAVLTAQGAAAVVRLNPPAWSLMSQSDRLGVAGSFFQRVILQWERPYSIYITDARLDLTQPRATWQQCLDRVVEPELRDLASEQVDYLWELEGGETTVTPKHVWVVIPLAATDGGRTKRGRGQASHARQRTPDDEQRLLRAAADLARTSAEQLSTISGCSARPATEHEIVTALLQTIDPARAQRVKAPEVLQRIAPFVISQQALPQPMDGGIESQRLPMLPTSGSSLFTQQPTTFWGKVRQAQYEPIVSRQVGGGHVLRKRSNQSLGDALAPDWVLRKIGQPLRVGENWI